MHDEYRAFLRLFGAVARYGCDFSPTDSTPDDFQRPLHISQEEFLADIYEPRGVEQKILDALRTNPNLICLVGAQGAGKSSIAYKLRQELAAKAPTTFAVFMDMRLEVANNSLKTSPLDDFEPSLRRRLIDEYRERLFPLTRTGDNPRLRLWAYLLERRSAIEKPLHLFASFTQYQDTAARYLRRYDEAHPKEQSIAVIDWLAKTYTSHDDVSELTEKLDAALDFSHLVHAARFIAGHEQQVVWLDNIDALNDDLQTEAIHASKRIFLPVQSYVGMLVAVREENIFRDYDLCDEGAPPYETRIVIEMPKAGEDYAYYPSQDVPVAAPTILKGIVRRRLEATRQYQIRRVNQINGELQKLSEATEPAQRAGLTRELESLLPVVSPMRFAQLELAADHLFDAMNSERAIYLNNNSLRDYLFMFRDCLADLFRDPEDAHGAAPATKYADWLIATLVLRRARHALRRYQVGVYDVIAAMDEYHRGDTSRPACLLPYLIITTTWNLTLKHQNDENKYGFTPTVADVEAEIMKLGYSSKEIRRTMHAHYFRNNARNNLIEFRARSILRQPSDVRDDHVIYVTYRGKCLVGRTGSSFGYLYDCLALLTEPDSEKVGTIPNIQDKDNVIEELLPHLCDMADVHYRSLKNIRDNQLLGPGDWLTRYYAVYGTPQVDPYGRSGGRRIAGRYRMLLLEGILQGLLGYIRFGSAHERLSRLLAAFLGALNTLSTDENPVHPSFRQIMGLPPRAGGKRRGK